MQRSPCSIAAQRPRRSISGTSPIPLARRGLGPWLLSRRRLDRLLVNRNFHRRLLRDFRAAFFVRDAIQVTANNSSASRGRPTGARRPHESGRRARRPSPASPIASVNGAADARNRHARALGNLSPRQRRVFLLRGLKRNKRDRQDDGLAGAVDEWHAVPRYQQRVDVNGRRRRRGRRCSADRAGFRLLFSSNRNLGIRSSRYAAWSEQKASH